MSRIFDSSHKGIARGVKPGARPSSSPAQGWLPITSHYTTAYTWLPFSQRHLRSGSFVTTSILFLSDLEDYSDSMLAGQP